MVFGKFISYVLVDICIALENALEQCGVVKIYKNEKRKAMVGSFKALFLVREHQERNPLFFIMYKSFKLPMRLQHTDKHFCMHDDRE